MEKKVEKRKKIKAIPVMILLLFLILLYFGIMAYIDTKLENIIITGNSKLSDQLLIELVGLDTYPAFVEIDEDKIEEKILEFSVVKSVDVRKEFYHKVIIDIEEYDYLFVNKTTNNFVVETGEEIDINDSIVSVPTLLNYVPDEQYDRFVLEMSLLEPYVLSKISEIEYLPNEYDPDRFLLYMADGNSVYLTLTKFEAISHYNDVVLQLEGKKGILYLDSGNHFEIYQ